MLNNQIHYFYINYKDKHTKTSSPEYDFSYYQIVIYIKSIRKPVSVTTKYMKHRGFLCLPMS